MAVRFKFRSSSAVDSIDLGGRPSISVHELRSKILDSSKLLRSSSGFRLVISDATCNETFDDEDFQIPAGSDVIIKRVPSGPSAPEMDNMKVGSATNANAPSPKNVNMDNFEDFGNEVYPTFDSLGESDQGGVNLNNKDNARSRYHNNDESDLSEAISKEIVGENCKFTSDSEEEDRKESKTKTRSEEHKRSNEGGKCSSAMFNTDLPTELRCPLCHAIFKEAVLIPCCQHSFCDKCIRTTLIEVKKCPKCSSPKCSIGDLLPNLSLRQAIERFIEAQASIGAMDNDLLPKDAPDGESGIQAIEATPSNLNVNLNSPTATGKGSNKIQLESTPDNKRNSSGIKIRLDESKPVNPTLPPPPSAVNNACQSQTSFHNNDINKGAEVQVLASGSNIPRYPQDHVEGNMPIQRRSDFAFNNQDGGFQQQNKFNNNRRGDRTCYFCGSPGHFIRDCPNRFSGDGGGGYQGNNNNNNNANNNNNLSGYNAPPVDWAGLNPAFNAYPRPAYNMYANPYDATGSSFPISPYQMSSYSPFYSGMANPYGYMRMGGMGNMGNTGNMGGMGPALAAGVPPHMGRPEYMDPRTNWYGNNNPGDLAERDMEDEEEYQYKESQANPPRRRPHESDSESLEEENLRNRPPPQKKRDIKHYSSDEETRLERKQERERGERERAERERERRAHHSEKEKSIPEASSERYSRRERERKGKEVSERRKEPHSAVESRERRNSSVKGKEVNERRSGHHRMERGRESERWEMVDGSDDERRRERERHHRRKRR